MRTGGTPDAAAAAERVELLLRKTIENSATPGEEASAVQLAHMIARQHGLDMDLFKTALAGIGNPPRYRVTNDGFLVPADVARPAEAQASATPRDPVNDAAPGPAASASANDDFCTVSPTRRHRMEKYMRGTMATGALYCIHCGIRIEAGDFS